jgi:beta-1,4-mannooligosaccharide/beta-1,4-mannosyl-N-acetylglucosamine phosphorylase
MIQRHSANPVLTADDVPLPCTQVFNAGVTKFNGQYIMVFRADTFDHEGKCEVGTFIGLARSDDGVDWQVDDHPCFAMGHRTDPSFEISRAYDPRLTVIDGRCYMCFAIDTRHGVCGGIAVTDDFKTWEVLTNTTPDNRNMVLFPEKVDGKFCRLERPFPIYGRGAPEAFDIWFGASPDCRYWGDHELVLGSDHVPYCNCKIGPAAPPIKTDRGWLTTIHAVNKSDDYHLRTWHRGAWQKRYMAGLILLDLDQPWRVIGMARQPLLDPSDEYAYEKDGFRGDVIFPGGMIAEPDGSVKIYYGASDTYVALATSTIDELLATIEPYEPPHRTKPEPVRGMLRMP